MLPEIKPWNSYAVGVPSTRSNWTNADCWPMQTISHVTHIENAISILKHGKILPQLVYDKSILNRDRILVNWLSPNHWNDGFRYGNVAFQFDFQTLINGMSVYWVESMTEYTPNALRILFTKQDRGTDPRLQLYNPNVRDGPWWFDESSGIHYRNPLYTLEFMFENEIEISSASEISVVKHHPNFCCVDYSTCPDRGMDTQDAGMIFAAGIALNGMVCSHLPISDSAYNEFCNKILWQFHHSKSENFIGVSEDQAVEAALANAWLSAIFFRNSGQQQTLRQLFKSSDRFIDAVSKSLIASFGAEKLSAIIPAKES